MSFVGAPWARRRSIVLDDDAQEFVDSTPSDQNRFGDQWEGLEWLLAHTPEVGKPRSSKQPTEFLLLPILKSEMADTRDIVILYSYDDNTVTIHSAAFTDTI